jgi:hypothetical protein
VPAPRDRQVIAHGLGGLSDLPVQLSYVLIAAVVVLLVSFAVLGLAWREPRFTGDESGVPLPGWLTRFVESPLTRGVVVALALAFTAWVTFAAFFGENLVVNPVFGSVYALLWVGLVPAALLFGPVYRLCNPLRWIHRGICALLRRDPAEAVIDYPEWLGMWPAALGLYAFTWLELVNPDYSTSLPVVRAWFLGLALIVLAIAGVFGDRAFGMVDPFEVYSSLVARLSPFGRRTDRVLVIRSPLDNLAGLVAPAGAVGVVSVLFGSTAFDSFHDSVHWLRFSQHFGDHTVALDSAALLLFCLVVLVTFCAAAVLTGLVGDIEWRQLPRLYAHTLVPIVVGYIIAHYLTFYVSVGIETVQQLGDPLSRGWTLTSFASGVNPFAIYNHPTAIGIIKVVAVVTGHVLAVIAAHDRSVALLPRRKAVIGQLPMLTLMVAYTLAGLALLFSS